MSSQPKALVKNLSDVLLAGASAGVGASYDSG